MRVKNAHSKDTGEARNARSFADQLLDRLKNNRMLAFIMVSGLIVIGIWNFHEAAAGLYHPIHQLIAGFFNKNCSLDDVKDTWCDPDSGLLWRLSAYGDDKGILWTDAKEYCAIPFSNLKWRLPTIKELETLKKYDSDNPSLNIKGPLHLYGGALWSSTVRHSLTPDCKKQTDPYQKRALYYYHKPDTRESAGCDDYFANAEALCVLDR